LIADILSAISVKNNTKLSMKWRKRQMRTIYAQILERLHQGEDAVLVSELRPGRITKTLRLPGREGSLPGDNASPGQCIHIAESGDILTLTEHFFPKDRLVILGAGHIALPLAAMGTMLHFEVVVFDDRPSFANRERFPDARDVVCDYFDNMRERLALCSNDFVAIVTRGHRYDQLCLQAILNGEIPRYLGMIGSKRRVGIILEQLRASGHAPEKLARLHTPIGLDIGAVTPEEIALAILGEMVRERRMGQDANKTLRRGETPDVDVLQWLAEEHTGKSAIITVLSVKGSAPRGAGAKMLVLDDGRVIGSIGGGCAEAEVIQDARRMLRAGGHVRRTVDLTDAVEENGMVCGGIMDVLIEVTG
jgi:xanthine dehydrogenase accessory factor